ncbi:Cullin-1 [Leucoagaricus sp. SymC.cos]|nr:Cullin-1 [Leucoagaricus sp. SymC.cos]
MFTNAHGFTISNPNFYEIRNNEQSGMEALLSRYLPDAAYDSAARENKASCYPGTRTQHIDDITGWATVSGQNPRRLFSMRGAAGTGKTSIAQSCAEQADGNGVLGASFFFWRDNGVVDPTCLFPTIAVQLSRKVMPYRAILERRVNDDPSLPVARMDTQLRELILKPFLELERDGIQIQPMIVIIDGLDEAAAMDAQSKIVELITKSVQVHGVRIPLLWAIFSRPESHITHAFSEYASSFSFYWEITLHASEELDDEIKLYLQGILHEGMARRTGGFLGRSSGTDQWPSDQDIEELVRLCRRLFIYATTLAKYIMNPNSYSPEKRLREVLSFHSTRLTPGDEQPNPLAELDAFYGMIMSRIPHDILLVAQQILLLHQEILLSHNREKTPLRQGLQPPQVWLLANLAGLSLWELVDALSSLHSVLMLRQVEGPARDSPFGSATLFFHHASFMEFLIDKQRSREYWIQDQKHWSSIASKCLHLVNKMHSMNSLPRDEKIRALRSSLTALPDKDWRVLQVRNELYYYYLHPNLFIWCARAGLETNNQILNELRLFDFNAFKSLGQVFTERDKLAELLSQACVNRYLIYATLLISCLGQYPEDLQESVRQVHCTPPDDSEWHSLPELTAPIPEICKFLVNGLDLVRCYMGSKHEEKLANFTQDLFTSRSAESRYIFSKIQEIACARYEEEVKKAQYLDRADLLKFYDNEWADTWDSFTGLLLYRRASSKILYLTQSYWNMKLFEAMGEQRYCRLTEAALSVLTQQEGGDLINRKLLTKALQTLFDAYELPRKCRSDIDPINTARFHRRHFEKGFFKLLSRRYAARAVEISLNSYPLPTFLDIVYDMFHEDCSIIGLRSMDDARLSWTSFLFQNLIQEACVQALVDHRSEEVCTEFGRLLGKSAYNSGHLQSIYRLFTSFQPKRQRLESLLEIFRTHVQKHALATLSNVGIISKDNIKGSTDPCVSTLLGIRYQYLEMVKDIFSPNIRFLDSLDEAFRAVIREYPQLCHPGLECSSKQEQHGIFGYSITDMSTSLEAFDISDVEWLQCTSGAQVVSNPVVEDSATNAQPELHQAFSHAPSISDVIVLHPAQLPEPVANVKEEEQATAISESSAPEPSSSSKKIQSRKRDKVLPFLKGLIKHRQ